jgi:hypothetical protein
MKVKKTLLASMALVALCLVAPTAASAIEKTWFDHDRNSTYSPPPPGKEVTPHANLTVTAGLVTYGPCQLALKGFVWNKEGGMGEGSLKLKEPHAACTTSTGGCTITSTTFKKDIGLTLMTNTNVRFSPIEFEWHLSGLCGGGTTKTVTGTVDGYFIAPTTNGATEWQSSSTVGFTSTPGLTVAGAAATLDGTIEFGTKFTVIP